MYSLCNEMLLIESQHLVIFSFFFFFGCKLPPPHERRHSHPVTPPRAVRVRSCSPDAHIRSRIRYEGV